MNKNDEGNRIEPISALLSVHCTHFSGVAFWSPALGLKGDWLNICQLMRDFHAALMFGIKRESLLWVVMNNYPFNRMLVHSHTHTHTQDLAFF